MHKSIAAPAPKNNDIPPQIYEEFYNGVVNDLKISLKIFMYLPMHIYVTIFQISSQSKDELHKLINISKKLILKMLFYFLK